MNILAVPAITVSGEPVLYHAENIGSGAKFLKIELTGRNPNRAGGNHSCLGAEIAGGPELYMNTNELKDFSQARQRPNCSGQIMPFWCGPAVDHEQGGWMGWLFNDLMPDRHANPRDLSSNSRILWAFSAVHRARPEKLFQQNGRSARLIT